MSLLHLKRVIKYKKSTLYEEPIESIDSVESSESNNKNNSDHDETIMEEEEEPKKVKKLSIISSSAFSFLYNRESFTHSTGLNMSNNTEDVEIPNVEYYEYEHTIVNGLSFISQNERSNA